MKKFVSKFTGKEIASYIIFILLSILGIFFFQYFMQNQKYNAMAIVLLIVWGGNLLVGALNFERRVIVFLFDACIFLFLLTRVLIPVVKDWSWWETYSVEANCFATCAILLSIISIGAGALLVEILEKINIGKNRKKSKKINRKKINKQLLIKSVRVILAVCMICYFIQETDKLLFMRGKEYEEFFTLYHSDLPFWIYFPAGCMNYFLCILLALKPSKKESFIWLFIYIVSAIPMLKIGLRNPIILNCIFAFVYYVLRDMIEKNLEKKWIGKKEKIIIICAIPVMVLSMGAFNYLRAGESVNMSIPDLVVDFAYKQGTTYDTVLQGYTYKDQLPMKNQKTYTLGALTDEFFYNTLGKELFKLDDIGEGNCLRQVYNGHTFSHSISYVVFGSDYLAGNGRGSSYIIENYVDWGYPGVILFSIFLGVVCGIIPIFFRKNWLLATIGLNMIISIFFTPRAESTAFITFLISYKFWMCVVGCIVLYSVINFWINKKKIKDK